MMQRESTRSWGAALRLGFSVIMRLPGNLRHLLRQLDHQEAMARQIVAAQPARSVDEAIKQMLGTE